VTLYSRSLPFRAVGQLLGTTAQSVLRRVCGYVDTVCYKPTLGQASVVEFDEMWHYVLGITE
jgi:predicted oxidoreductase